MKEIHFFFGILRLFLADNAALLICLQKSTNQKRSRRFLRPRCGVFSLAAKTREQLSNFFSFFLFLFYFIYLFFLVELVDRRPSLKISNSNSFPSESFYRVFIALYRVLPGFSLSRNGFYLVSSDFTGSVIRYPWVLLGFY